MADERVLRFIDDPAARTRDCTPSLGNLVHYLLILEDITWDDLAQSLIPEALRRHIIRQERAGKKFSSSSCGGSTQRLIAAWDRFAPHAGMVISCAVMFYKHVGRPQCDDEGLRWNGHRSPVEVASAYDRRWGRLRAEVIANIVSGCDELCQRRSILDLLAPIWPGGTNCSLDGVAQLILWAEKHGHAEMHRGAGATGEILEDQWPLFNRHVLPQQWQPCHAQHRGRRSRPLRWRTRI